MYNYSNIDGVVKTLHLLRCYIFCLISTYLSTAKLKKECAPRICSFLLSHRVFNLFTSISLITNYMVSNHKTQNKTQKTWLISLFFFYSFQQKETNLCPKIGILVKIEEFSKNKNSHMSDIGILFFNNSEEFGQVARNETPKDLSRTGS